MLCFHFNLSKETLNFPFNFFDSLVVQESVNFYVFMNFPVFFLLLISSFMPLLSEKLTRYSFNLLEFLKVILSLWLLWNIIYILHVVQHILVAYFKPNSLNLSLLYPFSSPSLHWMPLDCFLYLWVCFFFKLYSLVCAIF